MKLLKAAYHLGMCIAAIAEYRQSREVWRKQLCGGYFGFHLASAIIDWNDREEKPKGLAIFVNGKHAETVPYDRIVELEGWR